MKEIFRIKSISQFHEILGLARPLHPLISLIEDRDAIKKPNLDDKLFNIRFSSDLYSIMYKDKISGSIGYGRNTYDFQEGTIIFSSPGQVFTSPGKEDLKGKQGWTLLFHPDLIRKSVLGEKIDSYSFFSYEVNEALHLAPKEEKFLFELIRKIQEEYSQNIDQHSQTLIISNLELLLNYCMRFYDRQFYTRSNFNKDFVAEFELALRQYFTSKKMETEGLPSAPYFGRKLNMSTNYLSDMLKKETGRSIKEHIDGYIIDRAKSVLLSTNKKVSEIAYDLGFNYPQSFTRLFKSKTGMSPAEYRNVN
ncbi:MAG: helix-turn-helix transcriptional regulator [Saprospiraceae bacterium]|nr:helix-turn-helix transcriptional regulator [Saprospiraceae bacterium]